MHPTPRSAALFAAAIPLALLPAVIATSLWPIWLAALIALVIVHVLDALRVVAARRLLVELDVPAEVEIGSDSPALLALTSRGRDTRLTLTADLDNELAAWPEQQVRLSADTPVELRFPLLPSRRGTWHIRRLWLRWRGPLGLMARTWHREVDRAVHVVPDVSTARRTAVQFFGSRAAQIGARVEQFLGEGSEFESLRTWVPGLDPRSVDWKASARHRRLLCRRFRAERDQQIVLAIDAGHLMSEPLAGMPRLDHAISRALALAWVSLRSGDRVGLFAFDAAPRNFVAPQAGVRTFARLRHATAAVEHQPVETNFALGILELTRRLRRRSLVVVFTEFADQVTAELMLDHMLRLARRHVVLFVALRDPALDALERHRPDDLRQLHRAVLAHDLATERETVLETLRRAGVHVVDAAPDEASAELLSRYLAIKRRELV